MTKMLIIIMNFVFLGLSSVFYGRGKITLSIVLVAEVFATIGYHFFPLFPLTPFIDIILSMGIFLTTSAKLYQCDVIINRENLLAGTIYLFSLIAILFNIPTSSVFFYVSGPSGGETILMNEVLYANSNTDILKRGDYIKIIENAKVKDQSRSVKRIIGLPGEKIQIVGNSIMINDAKYVEPNKIITNECDLSEFSISFSIPEGEYFVMGDNRCKSTDSRYWLYPFVRKEDIEAIVVSILWSYNLGRIGIKIE